MEFLEGFFANPVIITAFFGWFVAQFLKILLDMLKTGRFDLKRFLSGAGGMPSSHTSLVISTVIVIYYRHGVNSTDFALSFILACIVIYDALGVRHAAGEQAKVLNVLIDDWDWEHPDIIGIHLKELLGHTPLEVATGAVLGVVIGLFMTNILF